MAHIRRSLIVASLVALALGGAGCQPELRVALASPRERVSDPAFTVSEPGTSGSRPRYDTIQLYSESGRLLWHLRAEPFGYANSVAQFRYSQALSGFTSVVAPAPLEVGQSYTLTVSGVGSGLLKFKVDADGTVVARP